jgi:hypothetical protein
MSMRGEADGAPGRAASAREREPNATPPALAADEQPAFDAGAVPSSPLSEADLLELERACARLRALGRAALLARLHGIGLLAFAIASALCALLEPALLWIAALAACSGAAESYGARLVRALDPRGPRWLGAHQLVLLAAVAAYAAHAIFAALGEGSVSAQLVQTSPELAAMLADLGAEQSQPLISTIDGAYRAAVVAFYLGVILVAALYQGAVAYYHFSRAVPLRAFSRETPRWARAAARRLLGW